MQWVHVRLIGASKDFWKHFELRRKMTFLYLLGCPLYFWSLIFFHAWLADAIVDIFSKGYSLNPFKTLILLVPLGISLIILFVTKLIDRRLQMKSTQ